MHQKRSNYALINLLFGLCRSVWVIELLVIFPSLISELQHAPLPSKCCEPRSTPQLLSPSDVFTFGLAMNPSKSLGVRQSSLPIGGIYDIKAFWYIIGTWSLSTILLFPTVWDWKLFEIGKLLICLFAVTSLIIIVWIIFFLVFFLLVWTEVSSSCFFFYIQPLLFGL
jgi:hypothetical protein